MGGSARAMQLAEAAGEHGVSVRAVREAAEGWITLGIMTLNENNLVFCEGIGRATGAASGCKKGGI
eukprot:11132707-Lingulodinium_polyedra.AAC.1